MIIQYFNAKKNTKRFKKGQKVWIRHRYANHLAIWSKWLGKGRYTHSMLDKWDWSSKSIEWNEVIGEEGLLEMEVREEFGKRVLGRYSC